jgi:hypothetical protein
MGENRRMHEMCLICRQRICDKRTDKVASKLLMATLGGAAHFHDGVERTE